MLLRSAHWYRALRSCPYAHHREQCSSFVVVCTTPNGICWFRGDDAAPSFHSNTTSASPSLFDDAIRGLDFFFSSEGTCHAGTVLVDFVPSSAGDLRGWSMSGPHAVSGASAQPSSTIQPCNLPHCGAKRQGDASSEGSRSGRRNQWSVNYGGRRRWRRRRRHSHLSLYLSLSF